MNIQMYIYDYTMLLFGGRTTIFHGNSPASTCIHPSAGHPEIRMIRMRIGFESAYEDSEVRDEALRAYLHLGAEVC